MREHELNPTRKRRLAAVAIALVSTAGFATFFTTSVAMPPPMGLDEGPWINASGSYDCSQLEAGTICAEWPDANAGTSMVCCVDPGIVGTYQKGAGEGCTLYLTERAID